MFRWIKSFLLVITLGIQPIVANAVEELNWDDLVPASAEFDDPFTRIDEQQLYELTIVAQVRDRREGGYEITPEQQELYDEVMVSLEDQEIDVDYLLSIRESVSKERVAKTKLADPELDKREIKIPGYLLPLEFEGQTVTEFLLVPYVGACIHVPPPPPNQIVQVSYPNGFEMPGDIYTPVWVEGKMLVENTESNLTYVDGSDIIPSAYRVEAGEVTLYDY